jgi:tetratricopeptide (TPR) repeat protein
LTFFHAHRINKPSDEYQFEAMCARIYGEVYGDKSPKRNGRRGQGQAGVDVFVRAPEGIVGIQCKRYKDGGLKLKHVIGEIEAASRSAVSIFRLIIATTAASDAQLQGEVLNLSMEREKSGMFPVEIDFWEEVEAHINGNPKLQALYDPTAPGGAFNILADRQDSISEAMGAKLELLSEQIGRPMAVVTDQSLPASLKESLNTVVTGQIDAINDLIKAAKYKDANVQLEVLARTFSLFDDHQRARWYVQRGVCRVHLYSAKGAADDLLEAARLYPNDDKIAAAGIRGLILQGSVQEAIAAGQLACARFPASVSVWTAMAYARLEGGESILIDQVPPGLETDIDVLAVLCWSANKTNDFHLAWSFGQKILSNPAAGYPSKTVALTAALSWAADDPVARNFGFIDQEARIALTEAVEAFEPLGAKLWFNQSLATLPADATNLCYAYYLLDRYDQVLAMCAMAESQAMLSDRMFALQLGTLSFMGRLEDMIRLAEQRVEAIDPAALMMVAEAAASCGAVKLVDALAQQALACESDDINQLAVGALRSLALLNAGRRSEAIAEAISISIAPGEQLGAAMVAVRTLLAADMITEALERIDEIAKYVPKEAAPNVLLALIEN